jgi:hypothetical protein
MEYKIPSFLANVPSRILEIKAGLGHSFVVLTAHRGAPIVLLSAFYSSE